MFDPSNTCPLHPQDDIDIEDDTCSLHTIEQILLNTTLNSDIAVIYDPYDNSTTEVTITPSGVDLRTDGDPVVMVIENVGITTRDSGGAVGETRKRRIKSRKSDSATPTKIRKINEKSLGEVELRETREFPRKGDVPRMEEMECEGGNVQDVMAEESVICKANKDTNNTLIVHQAKHSESEKSTTQEQPISDVVINSHPNSEVAINRHSNIDDVISAVASGLISPCGGEGGDCDTSDVEVECSDRPEIEKESLLLELKTR